MRKLSFIAALALAAVPSALAANPHPATPANSHASSHANAISTTGASSKAGVHAHAPKAIFVLRGTIGAYTPANGATNGSIVLTVKSANHESAVLKNSTLTIPVSSATKIVGTVTVGHKGVVKLRAAKNSAAATLQTVTAFQVIDQGTNA